MEIDLLGLLHGGVRPIGGASPDRPEPRVYGVVVGVVTDIEDPAAIGRVRVAFPTLADETDSAWARVVVPWAGAERGAYFLPEVEDEVLVAFREGDLGQPYVLGFLWSQTAPPQSTPTEGKSELRSALGQSISLDDIAGEVALSTSTGYQIRLSDSGASVTIADPTGNLSIALDAASGSITLTAPGQISLSAPSIDLAPPAPAGDFPTNPATTGLA